MVCPSHRRPLLFFLSFHPHKMSRYLPPLLSLLVYSSLSFFFLCACILGCRVWLLLVQVCCGGVDVMLPSIALVSWRPAPHTYAWGVCAYSGHGAVNCTSTPWVLAVGLLPYSLSFLPAKFILFGVMFYYCHGLIVILCY